MPGFKIEIVDGPVKLVHIFQAHLWSSDHDPHDLASMTYRKLMEVAGETVVQGDSVPCVRSHPKCHAPATKKNPPATLPHVCQPALSTCHDASYSRHSHLPKSQLRGPHGLTVWCNAATLYCYGRPTSPVRPRSRKRTLPQTNTGSIGMQRNNRREFLADVGRGMLVASVGSALALDLGLRPRWPTTGTNADVRRAGAAGGADAGDAGRTSLLPVLVDEAERRAPTCATWWRAAALANARTFGGEDYVGFHTLMALAPGLPDGPASCPRPAGRCRSSRCSTATPTASRSTAAARTRCCTRSSRPRCPKDTSAGEVLARRRRSGRTWTRPSGPSPPLAARSAGRRLQRPAVAVQDKPGRPPRRPALPRLGPARPDRAGSRPHTLLRQSVRYCVEAARPNASKYCRPSRGRCCPSCSTSTSCWARRPARRTADDAWVEQLSRTIFDATPEQAADAVAAALAEGIAPDAVGEAISLAANQLVLRDPGRPPAQAQPEQAGRQRPRRLDRRPRLRLGQRLAEHRPRQQRPQHASPA